MAIRYPLVRTVASALRQPKVNDSRLTKRLVSLPEVVFEDTTAPIFQNFVPANGYDNAIINTNVVFDVIDNQSGVDTDTIYVAMNNDWIVQAGIAQDGYTFNTTPIQSGFVFIGYQGTITLPFELEEFSSYSFDGYANDLYLNAGEGHWSFITGSRFDVPDTLFTEQFVADDIDWDQITIPVVDFDSAEDTFVESFNVVLGPLPAASEGQYYSLDNTLIEQTQISSLYDGTLVGAATFATGATPDGVGLSLDGVNGNHVSLPNLVGSTLNFAAFTSFSCWVRPAAVFQTRTIWEIRRGDGSNNHAMLLRLTGTGTIVFNTRPNSADTQVQVSSTADIVPNDEWTHIVVITQMTTAGGFAGDRIRIYVNGVLDTNAPQTFAASTYDGSVNAVYIGKDANTTLQNFAGVIDDVRMFRRVLTTVEITQLYQWRDWEGVTGVTTASEKDNQAEDTFVEQFIVPPWGA